ncbi:Crinkler effector protein 1 [Phytophthora ramorum]|uniref:Crinkler effector protein 1 n=1 Tax=Phytophthora ramorum TaxID=164328 RepID=UPI003098CFB0|nr:Crinkler effector protein 1 [Phytophthora ramorum]
MMKLVCAIVGVAGSAFSVRVDESDSVGDLKKAIKGEKPATITCDAKDLQVFLAKTEGGAWLDGAGAAAVALDERGHPQGCVQMDPTLWIKNPKHFGDNFQPGEGQVHVLVVVPEGAGSQAGVTASIEELGEIVETRVNKVFEDRDKKRSVYSLSDLHTEHRYKMAKKMRLADDYITFEEPSPSPNTRILPYTWLDAPEGADNQRAEYMTYLKTHLKTVLEEKDLSLLDVAKNQTVLSIIDPRLPFGMRGTTDVLLVDRRSIQHREPLAGVRMVVELKKKVEQHHKPEAFGELVSASLKAPLNCTPIALLTDLNDQWHFSWFNEKKVLTHISIVHPENAFDFIAAAVAEPASSKPFSVPFIGRELTKFKIDDFLPMPDDGADEMMERYELMADVVEPEFLMERRMEYARQLVQSMPMYAHMYT